MAIKRNVTNAEMKWERNSTLLVLIHRVVGSRAARKKKKKDFWSAAWKIQCTMMRFFHQSRVHIGSNHLYLVPAPFTNQPWDRSHTHTHLSLMMTKRPGGSSSHADTSSACTAGSFYPFHTTKVAQELFVQDLLNPQILDDCIYSRRFEGLSLFALCKKLRWMSTRDYVSRKAIQI